MHKNFLPSKKIAAVDDRAEKTKPKYVMLDNYPHITKYPLRQVIFDGG